MYYWISEAVIILGLLIALAMGRDAWANRKKALFPKLVAAGLGCMTLGCVHDMVYLLVTGTYANDVYVGHLGVMGCFLFLISASYGQLDGIFDDKSKENRKFRILALLAPLVLTLLFIPTYLSHRMTAGMKLVDYLGWLPIIVASYYNCKHAILPDRGFAFVKAVRPYNIAAVILEISEVLYLTMYTVENQTGIVVCSVFVAVSAVGVMYFAKKGAREWTI